MYIHIEYSISSRNRLCINAEYNWYIRHYPRIGRESWNELDTSQTFKHTHTYIYWHFVTYQQRTSILLSKIPRRSNSPWSLRQFFSPPPRPLVIHAPPAPSTPSRFILIVPGISFRRESAIPVPAMGSKYICVAISLADYEGQDAGRARGNWGSGSEKRGCFSRNVGGKRVGRMNGVRYIEYVCHIFWRASSFWNVGCRWRRHREQPTESVVGADRGLTGDGQIWLCVATSRLDLSSSLPSRDEKLGGKEGISLGVYPLGTTLRETEARCKFFPSALSSRTESRMSLEKTSVAPFIVTAYPKESISSQGFDLILHKTNRYISEKKTKKFIIVLNNLL